MSQALACDVTVDPQSPHAPTALCVPHGMPHVPLWTENQVGPTSAMKYIPQYTPPGHIPPDLPAVLAVWVFTHYTLRGEWPYRPHSRAHITVLAQMAVTATAMGHNFRNFPAFGEWLCSHHDISSIDVMHIIASIYDNCRAFPTIGNAFQLPPSIFAEVPVLVGIYN